MQMRRNRPQLPEFIVLALRPTQTQSEILSTLQTTRQSLSVWRRKYNFPKPIVREGWYNQYNTVALCGWLKSFGVEVRLV